MDAAQTDYVAVANGYARAAVADRKGKRHCKWVRLAAKRHLADLKKSKRKSYPYEFSDWDAIDVCGFIEKLPHVEGEWDEPTLVLEPWQVFITACVFGWRRKSDGKRRFSIVYIEVGRKNGKSTWTAGITLYCLTCDNEVGPQIIIGATTGEQAKKVFSPAKSMVEKTPDLREEFEVEAMARSITCRQNHGYIQTINAKSQTQDGWNPHVGVLDELHAHKERGLYDVIRSAFGSRKNPLLWIITTAGYNVLGVCYEQRKLLTRILDGVIEADHYFGIIYTLDDKDVENGREFDEATWIKSNPNLGVSIRIDELRGYATEAKASPDSHSEFLTKRLNVWVTAKKAWVNITLWKKCDGPVDLEALRSVPCWGGVDLASTLDMCAFRLIWKVDERILTWGRFYLPENTVTPRTEKGNVPYQTWAKAGLLTVTPGAVTDYEYIERDIVRAMDEFDIQTIAFDPWNARDLTNRLMAQHVPLIEFRQGIPSYNAPMKEVERAYQSGMLAHGGDPILTWNASNVVKREDVNENMAPDKKNSEEKIDGFAAMVMAVGVMLTAEEDVGRSLDEALARRGMVSV